MKDKIVLITGATSGIGKAAARSLARAGAQVIIHGRNKEKAEFVKREILTRYPLARISILIADLSLMADVRAMAAEFSQSFDHLDVLINNAGGVMGNKRELTAEGNEKTLALNLLAPFLLTALLFPKLEASPSARIINVSSEAHRLALRINFSDLQHRLSYSPLRAYGEAKLFLILISELLAEKIKTQRIPAVTVNTVHPGVIATNFARDSNFGGLLNALVKIVQPFLKTPQQGADTIIYLASAKEAEGVTGKYFTNRKPAKVAEKYNTKPNEDKIWTYCEEVTGEKFM